MPNSTVRRSSRPYSRFVSSDSLREIDGLGRRGLHPESQLVGLDPGVELGVLAALLHDDGR